MEFTHAEITDYWSRHQDEVGLSVDWAEAEELCWRCAARRNLERCHIVPRALGGPEQPSNLVLLCAQCHAEAPNVADASFMWVWLRAHAASYYGTYWLHRGWREYEFIYGKKPFEAAKDPDALLQRLQVALKTRTKQVSAHWGQCKLNPATIAWLLRQVESEIATDDA
jgi:hypothetical protein